MVLILEIKEGNSFRFYFVQSALQNGSGSAAAFPKDFDFRNDEGNLCRLCSVSRSAGFVPEKRAAPPAYFTIGNNFWQTN